MKIIKAIFPEEKKYDVTQRNHNRVENKPVPLTAENLSKHESEVKKEIAPVSVPVPTPPIEKPEAPKKRKGKKAKPHVKKTSQCGL